MNWQYYSITVQQKATCKDEPNAPAPPAQKGDKIDPCNYKVISLIRQIGRLFGNVVTKHLESA